MCMYWYQKCKWIHHYSYYDLSLHFVVSRLSIQQTSLSIVEAHTSKNSHRITYVWIRDRLWWAWDHPLVGIIYMKLFTVSSIWFMIQVGTPSLYLTNNINIINNDYVNI